MVGLIVSMVGGVLAGLLALRAGLPADAAVWISLIGAVVVFVVLASAATRQVPRNWAMLEVRFPSTDEPTIT